VSVRPRGHAKLLFASLPRRASEAHWLCVDVASGEVADSQGLVVLSGGAPAMLSTCDGSSESDGGDDDDDDDDGGDDQDKPSNEALGKATLAAFGVVIGGLVLALAAAVWAHRRAKLLGYAGLHTYMTSHGVGISLVPIRGRSLSSDAGTGYRNMHLGATRGHSAGAVAAQLPSHHPSVRLPSGTRAHSVGYLPPVIEGFAVMEDEEDDPRSPRDDGNLAPRRVAFI